MYNIRSYKSLIENNILHSRQFGFQNGNSTDYAAVQLVDQITESFENNKHVLGVLIDITKAFDTVDHSIFLKKLELYGIMDRNHGWVKSYLSSRRQFIQIDEKQKSNLRDGQLRCSTKLNFRTTLIASICERLKKYFKHIGFNSVCRWHQLIFYIPRY